jgi:hypothetical protein
MNAGQARGTGWSSLRRVFAMPREEEGICIATGLELAGSRTVLIFQDNGIGNLLTALLTLPVAFPDSAIVLTLGGTAREMLAVAGRKANHIISLDAMGQTVSLALGLALGLEAERPNENLMVMIEGDGALIMGLSVMSTVGHLKRENLSCLFWTTTSIWQQGVSRPRPATWT